MRLSRSFAVVLLAAFPLAMLPPAPAHSGCKVKSYTYDRGGRARSRFPNDPLFPKQWGLDQINVPQAWARGVKGKGAVIAIIDSGVDLKHPDLRKKLVGGVDLVSTRKNDCPPGPQDEFGHGTAVAGVAAASIDNGIGIAGVAPAAKIMPISFIHQAEPTRPETFESFDRRAAKAIRYAANHGADVINMSFDAFVDPLFGFRVSKAVQYAGRKGVVLVAAAGNFSLPVCGLPAGEKFVICVAATNRRGLPTAYSNFPIKPGLGVAVRAPGGEGGPREPGSGFCENDEGVWTTMWPGWAADCGPTQGYDSLAGTSFASPHVAGVAALLAGEGLTSERIANCLKATSLNPLSKKRGQYDPIYGYGLVDADKATATCIDKR